MANVTPPPPASGFPAGHDALPPLPPLPKLPAYPQQAPPTPPLHAAPPAPPVPPFPPSASPVAPPPPGLMPPPPTAMPPMPGVTPPPPAQAAPSASAPSTLAPGPVVPPSPGSTAQRSPWAPPVDAVPPAPPAAPAEPAQAPPAPRRAAAPAPPARTAPKPSSAAPKLSVAKSPAASSNASAADEEFEATVVIARGRTQTGWKLIDIDGTEFPLDAATVVGRKPTAAKAPDGAQLVALSDPGKVLSRTHALIEAEGDRLWVTDLGSTNGTDIVLANAEYRECEPGERTELPDGCSISLGGREVSFEAPPTPARRRG